MPLLTVVNLTTSAIPLQDPSGMTSFSKVVPASGTLGPVAVTLELLANLEPVLLAEATASRITWTCKDDPASQADNPPANLRTALVTPDNVAVGDDVVLTNLTVAGAVSVVLPAAAMIGKDMVVLDGKGDANTNNVTVTVAGGGTINGGASYVISLAKGAVRLLKVSAAAWVAYSMSPAGSISGSAGGDLTGTYPNPTLASNSVDSDEIAVGGVTAPNIATNIIGVNEALAASGAISITKPTTRLDASGGNLAMTLADGAYVGQRKSIVAHIAPGANHADITPATFGEATKTKVTLAAKYDSTILEWQVGGWIVLDLGGTAAVG